jgi:hypothetical protein
VYNTSQSLVAMLNRAAYRVILDCDIPDAAAKVAQFSAADEVVVERKNKNRSVNIRPSVVQLESNHRDTMHQYSFTLTLGEPSVAKPQEVIRALTGMPEEVTARAIARRVRLFAARGGRELSPLDLV